MTTVITYGTFDLIHDGHIRLLERAKALGDYLIVAVTSDDFDRTRGKINVIQSLDQRIENVRRTKLADRIIIEEYEGQKIDDISRYNVDIFTVGSDWVGKFDYLKKYCNVVYLERTEGISSTSIRSSKHIKLGFIGDYPPMIKYINECDYVNGINVTGVCSTNERIIKHVRSKDIPLYNDYNKLLSDCDAIYIVSDPKNHYNHVKTALNMNRHVLVQSPICINLSEYEELVKMADSKKLVLMDGIKTAYSIAFNRLCLLVETGAIGEVVSIESTCTSIAASDVGGWNSISTWGPIGLLPIFKILGKGNAGNFRDVMLYSRLEKNEYDSFSKIIISYDNAIATVNVGIGVKSEGDLVIAGTKGYVYVPAPWWKTDYFEIRYEDITKNRRYFYELQGEGTRLMLLSFARAIVQNKDIRNDYSSDIINCIQMYYDHKYLELKTKV